MSETPSSPAAPPPFYRAPPPRKRPAWRTWMWIGVAVLVAILAAMLLTPHPDQHARGRGGAGGGMGGGGRGMPTVVGVATAVKGDIPITLGALGTVTPEATVTVQSQIAGTLEKVDFTEGQMVKKGQLLAEVDERPYIVALAQAQGALARDQASLADARLDLKRYQTLAKQDSVAGQTVDTQAALVKQDEGTVKTDEANIASAKLNLVYCHVIAPVSGRVGLRQVDPGNYITSASTTGVVVITEIDPIDIVFTLPEDDLPQVQARIAEGATLSVTALDRTGAITLAHGALLTLDNQIDTSTGTVKAKARFANPSGMLFPQQFVNVTLLVNTLKDAVVIPTQAVRHGSKGDYVFTVEQDPLMGGSTAKMTVVKLGPADGDRTSIASGLAVGDQVVTDGGDRLTDGSTIFLPGQTPPMGRPKKPGGFFNWLAGLFGHKPAAAGNPAGGAPGDQAAASPAGGGGYSGGAAAGAAGGGGHGGGAARMQAMLGQLNLTPDQQAKVSAIQAAMRQKIQAAGDDPDARRAAMHDGMTQITAILTPAQKLKLAQLRDQAHAAGGGGSDSSASGAAAVGSSATTIGAPPSPVAPPPEAPDSSAPPPPAAAGGPGGGGPGGGGPGRGGSGGRAALMAMLTDDQKAKVKAIIDDAKASGDFSQVRGKIAAILTPDQKAKMATMRAQSGGGGDQ